MKRLLPAFALVCLLFATSNAGDTTGPPAIPPPPACTENCTNSTTIQSAATSALQGVIDLLLKLRP